MLADGVCRPCFGGDMYGRLFRSASEARRRSSAYARSSRHCVRLRARIISTTSLAGDRPTSLFLGRPASLFPALLPRLALQLAEFGDGGRGLHREFRLLGFLRLSVSAAVLLAHDPFFQLGSRSCAACFGRQGSWFAFSSSFLLASNARVLVRSRGLPARNMAHRLSRIPGQLVYPGSDALKCLQAASNQGYWRASWLPVQKTPARRTVLIIAQRC